MILELERANLSELPMQCASAATIGAARVFEADAILQTASPGNWGQGNTPAAATQATTSKAAGAAGVRHVCTVISCTFSTGATAQAVPVVLVLRDGASGLGAILLTKQAIVPVNGIWETNMEGLNLVGSPATAMTLEYTAAGVAGSFQSVSLTGYDAG